MEEIPLYNSRIIKTYVEYLKKFYPTIDVVPILKGADISMHQLEDGGHWFTQRQCDIFQEILAETTGNANIPLEVGRYLPFSKASGLVSQLGLGLVTPQAAYKVLGSLYMHFSRASIIETRRISNSKIEIDAIPKIGVSEKLYQCENRVGTFEAMAKLFTSEYAKIEHPLCLHKGADFCRYILSFEITSSSRWKRLKNYALFLVFIACIGFLSLYRPPYWDNIILIYIIFALGFTAYSISMEKTELTRKLNFQGDTAKQLLDQFNQRYDQSMLIKEIGQATSKILNIENLLVFIMEALEKRLDFDRGMIMLVNKERSRLVYKVGFGYTSDSIAETQKMEFHLDKPDSKGVVVETFRKKTPFLIDDITEFERNFSERSRNVARKMEVTSFICVPIVFEEEALGVLMVDNLHSKRRLTESDMSLLMGIAPQIAISITNATAFERVRSSEERFKALSENAPDIIYTLDRQGIFAYVNPAWERVLGHTESEVLGKSYVNFIHKEDMELFTNNFDRIRKKRDKTINMFGRLNHKNGEERLFSMSGAPNLDANGQVIGVVGTFKDITDLKRSEAELQVSFNKLKSAMNSTIDAISLIVESRDPYTAGHQKRVASLAVAIAEIMNLTDDQINKIHMGSLIHDIGKIHIPAEILTKPGRLSNIEYEMMKAHPEIGYKILKAVDFIPPIAQMVYQHHERMDGSGYPLGIYGEGMLLESRIIAVADTVEAMASHRPYRPAIGMEKALETIAENKGKLYDSQVVDACLLLFREKGFQLPDDDHSPIASNGL